MKQTKKQIKKQTKKRVALTALGGLAICATIFLTGPEPLIANVPERQPEVSTKAPIRSTIFASLRAYGSLIPRQSLHLTSQVPGELVWVSEKLQAGGEVAEGEELFHIDPLDYEIALASAEAKHAQAEARIDLERGHAENAKLGWSKWQTISGEYDEASGLALREPQQAEVLALRALSATEIDKAKLALKRTIVKTPWAASVISANAVEGQVVSVGDVTATLYPRDSAIVELQVPRRTLDMIGQSDPIIELQPVDDLQAAPVIGQFQGIVQSLSKDTRLVTLRVLIQRPLDNPGWVFGMHLTAKIVSSNEISTVRIPANLVVNGNLIWVCRNGQALRHQLAPIQSEAGVILVEDNFQPKDQIIFERPIGLFDGAKVLAVAKQ